MVGISKFSLLSASKKMNALLQGVQGKAQNSKASEKKEETVHGLAYYEAMEAQHKEDIINADIKSMFGVSLGAIAQNAHKYGSNS